MAVMLAALPLRVRQEKLARENLETPNGGKKLHSRAQRCGVQMKALLFLLCCHSVKHSQH